MNVKLTSLETTFKTVLVMAPAKHFSVHPTTVKEGSP